MLTQAEAAELARLMRECAHERAGERGARVPANLGEGSAGWGGWLAAAQLDKAGERRPNLLTLCSRCAPDRAVRRLRL